MKTNFKFPDDLVPGKHFVQYSNGDNALVLTTGDREVFFWEDKTEVYMLDSDFDSTGSSINGDLKITHVYEIEDFHDPYASNIVLWKALDLHEKVEDKEEDVRDITISEIEEILGHKIRITG